jgi:hypothetical protein
MQSISATPSVNTTYGITVTDANGCSTSATKAITLAPQNLNLDITTGKNSSNNFIQFQQPDDDWKIVNFPGQTDYSWFGTPYAVDPVSLYAPGGLTNWVSSSNARWITSDYYGNGPSPFATASVYPTPNAKNARYFYEYAFNLPVAYSNLKVNINELAVDNNADIYMNTDYLISGNSTNNLEYSLSGYSIGNYSSIHGPLASIATTQSHYNIGLNKLDIVIGNGGGGPPNGGNYSYSGLLLNGSITGTCSPTQRLASSYVDQNVLNVLNEGNDIASLFSIYPNPAVDVLSINYLLKNSDKANVMILDITGTIKFKSQIDSESSKMDINLSEFSAGFYFVCVERNGIIIKKEKIVLAK